MAKLLQQINLVLWKHAVVRRRNIIVTLFEIVVPVVLILVLACVLPGSYPKSDAVVFEPQDPAEVLHSSLAFYDTRIYYAPSTSFTDKLMNTVDTALHGVRRSIIGVQSEDDIVSAYNAFEGGGKFIGIIFDNIKEDELPTYLRYRVRSEATLNIEETFSEAAPEGPNVESEQYIKAGVAALQLYIDSFFIDMARKESGVHNKDLNITRLVQKFPYPPSTHVSPTVLGQLFAVLIVLGFSFLCSTILKRIVSEKETGVKELMKLMGLKSWMLWTGWLVNALFVNMISVTGIVLVMKFGVGKMPPLIEKADATVLWVFLIVFCISSIVCFFAISSFFEKATMAVTFGSSAWFVLYFAVHAFSGTAGKLVEKLLCLLPQGGLLRGLIIMWQYELRGDGLQWNTVISPPVGNPEDLTMADVFLMYLLSILLYILITNYMDTVKPGKYGVARSWYYMFPQCFRSNNGIENLETQADVQRNFEAPPDNLEPGIRIKNLFKIYTSLRKSESKVAVKGITLDIYNGEITALLGHNGAGKTTTMSILSGMFSATSGSVMINGYDTKDNLDKIRENLGLCPQENMLFCELTVEEHLIFFGMLKGLSKKTAKYQTEDILNKLDLVKKKHCLPSQLSGGMKRKLSLGVALSGDAKVLILDEPTSGMDVEVRRQVWNLLLSMRGQKTILISTQYMEEADVLGDRVAIMDHGKIKCYGTTLFLKKLYGSGYNLSIIKLDGCNESAVWETVTTNVPEAAIKNLNGPIMCISLPLKSTSKFPSLFDALEANKNTLKIGGIGVSLTTMEEVFLNVGKESEDEASEHGSVRSETIDESHRLVDTTDALTRSRVSGLKLILRQFPALLVNNILFTYRNWFTHLTKVLLAVGFVSYTVILSLKYMVIDKEIPAHVFSLNDYGRTEVFLQPGLCSEDLIQSYEKEIESTESTLTAISSSNDIGDVLLQQGVSNIARFREKIIVAAEFKCDSNSVQANALYSNVALHGFPISVNIMSNAMLKFFNNKFSIVFSYHPFKTKEPQETVPVEIIGLLWVVLTPFAVLYVVSNFVTLPLLERVAKSKQIKFMAGVNPITYWLSHFLWDFVCFTVVIVMLLACIIVCDHHGFFTKPEMLCVFVMLLILYGFSAIPFTYVCSYLRGTVSSAFNLIVTTNLIVGLIGCAVVYLMSLSPNFDTERKIIDTVLHMIPHYTLSSSMKKYATITAMRINCVVTKQPGCDEDMSYFATVLPKEFTLTEDIMFFGIDGLVFFFILLLIEYGLTKKIYALIEKLVFKGTIVRGSLDDDVKEEELRVKMQLQGIVKNDALLVYNLVKKYHSFPAVKGISFGVREGECFGLLGTNGAGKTTTFQMLTGDIIPTSGEVSIFEYKLRKNKQKYLSHIGYCPQFDALDEHLTGHEMLSMYAKLRGVPDTLITSQINLWTNLLGLNEYRKKLCGTYSGGNKRKLSAAVALIGNPPIVFLDEPTSGVDPVSRRKLWNVLGKIHKTGQAVVLTSHSMEECEALCTRLAIMVAGQFMCMGNSQYLKQVFGQGFTVVIKIKSGSDIEQVNKPKFWFQEKFKNNCILQDEHVGLLHYQITNPQITLKQLFTTLEDMKKNFSVLEDYAVSETTLEQIFMSFARQNTDGIASV
ncbi:phospholipid-transporting ATPase ABCA1-like isoform X1 [Schistocerca piceifrons]|uniref:phospholipid-transporting ATPase ABCA1-like isoform X1 n=1 Tax=Schistocerca piceifrons TaxID=274613 RepID=UPI001F5F4532|nr:phospholipid-transporting ATPase ABCA1-like isoform X1 [Schistocerca piceifrons]